MKLKAIYTRPRMDKLLATITDYPLCCIIAGAGYGKTTAATEFLKKAKLPYALVTLTDGDGDVLWDKLCAGVELHSKAAADALRVLGLPTGPWPTSRAVNLAREKCKHPFIICIDDYQLLPDDSPVHHLIETITFEAIPNLHLLVLSRAQPNIRLYTLTSKEMALCIDADTLAFDVKETDGYLSMRGLRLTKGAVESIHESSGGWVSAIYLLGEGIRAGGTVGRGKGIDMLFEENLIKPMPEIDRDMLYRLSTFESFPLDLVVVALGMERIREVVAALLRENAFITLDENDEYRFHPLLREYLYSHCPQDEEQKAICRRASLWYAARKDRKYFYSVELVQKADCVEEYLSYFNKPGANRLNYYDMNAICRMAMELPDDMCLTYPFPYLQICFYLLLSGEKRYRIFAGKLLTMIRETFSTNGAPYSNIILGELLVISRVTGFGQLEGESEPLEEAARLFSGRQSEIVNPCDPFTFGLPMLLHSEFMKAGTLDEAVKRCQYNPYELVSDGFGRGSEPLVKAEAALLRCDMKQAKLYAEQAITEAMEKRQYFVSASAHSTLLRRALFLSDEETAVKQLENLRTLVTAAARELPDKRLTVRMLREALTLAQCFYDTSLLRLSEIPPDFLDGTHQSIMAAGLGIPQVYAARAMYATGNPMGALRLCERMGNLPSLCQGARLYGFLLTAVCREALSSEGSGLPSLITALTEAQKDGIILPFAENPAILPLLQRLKSNSGIDERYLSEVRKQCAAYKTVAPSQPMETSVTLSERELEALRLSAQGKTRKAIAQVLGVQEETVKKHLATAYKKLGAKGKTEAATKARALGILSR
ncbi:MAG: LuxR C-terminal-related transcriptional regulator [Eubacteriales bacterium]|nr:LuxR C-terminal-related transcriptional regulator [Eubacteriales bacterium]